MIGHNLVKSVKWFTKYSKSASEITVGPSCHIFKKIANIYVNLEPAHPIFELALMNLTGRPHKR